TDPSPPKKDDERWCFEIDKGKRKIQDVGGGRWAEYIDSKLWRMHKEGRRTDEVVELYTDDPKPTVSRLFDDHILWRTVGDRGWRQGSSGHWREGDPGDSPPPHLSFLIGTWEFQDGAQSHMRIEWDKEEKLFKGFLTKPGVAPQNVGFSVGEHCWT